MDETHATVGPDGTAASPPDSPVTSGSPGQPHTDAEATGVLAKSPEVQAERTWRGDWKITVVIAVLILALVGALYLTNSHRGRHYSLPSTLLGLHQLTGPQELQWARDTVRNDTSQGSLGAPVAATYGASAGAAFAVVVGTPCPGGTCMAPTTQQLVQSARANGHSDAAAFSPGAHGGNLICYSDASKTIGCNWVDQNTEGQVYFNGVYAANLADAAGKTRQLRDAIEH